MAEQAKVPAIRFAGFTDPWEQRKLGEVATRVTRKNEGESDLPLTISAQHGLVDQRTFFNNQVASKDMSGYYLLRKGEFAYNKSTSGDSPWGAVKRLVNYEKGCVSTLYICFGLDGTDPNYLVTYYETDCWHKGVQMIAAEGARNHGLLNIAPNDFFDTVLALPSSQEEQRRVGSLFARLDSLITLHQRKYDKLVVFKKSMLEKMFPKDGESVPEIRFAGFTDPWEQRKLGELEKDATLYMGRGRVISAKDMSNTPGTFPVYSSSALDDGRMGAYGKYMFNQELITWSIDGGGAVFYRRKHRFSVTNVSGYIAVNPEKISCKFLAYAMSLAHSRIKFDYTVKAHPSVIRSLYTMGIPISLQEQQVIGSFFSRLDELITLHQRKLELLQNIKKSLLDKMFA